MGAVTVLKAHGFLRKQLNFRFKIWGTLLKNLASPYLKRTSALLIRCTLGKLDPDPPKLISFNGNSSIVSCPEKRWKWQQAQWSPRLFWKLTLLPCEQKCWGVLKEKTGIERVIWVNEKLITFLASKTKLTSYRFERPQKWDILHLFTACDTAYRSVQLPSKEFY